MRLPSTAWQRAVLSAVLALAAVAVLVFEIALPGLPITAARADPPGPAFIQTVNAVREHLRADGTTTTVESANVTVSVSETQNLRGRQQVAVSWSGAHPTGGIVSDPNAANAARQEYPVVIMQCRGIDGSAALGASRLDPTTCWTQTATERYDQSFGTAFPPWRVDRHAAAGERRGVVSAPDPNPCVSRPVAERFVPFVSAAGQTYYGGANGCAGSPPESATAQNPSTPPGNTTYAVTRPDGNGSSTFVIWTAQQNASLGCSNTVPCALVIIPIVGLSCDVSGAALPLSQLPVEDRPAPGAQTDQATADCEADGRYEPGELFSSDTRKGAGDTAVTGAMWWSASNWLNRITVPLHFAPPANVCDILDERVPLDLYGSELMNQATNQWAALFCQDPRRFKFRHVRTGEPQAKAALDSGQIVAALVSRPPPDGYAKPTVTVPVAVTGFAITFTVDDADKRPTQQLRLNPRLLAKLMSESYWALQTLKTDYAALPASDPYRVMATNPQDMSVDPEFVALNPGIGESAQNQTASTLLNLSGDSDVLYALTSYINADPEARAFLNGQPDPWGMRVNPSYRDIALPLPYWPLLDSFLSPEIDIDGCLRNESGQILPVPILPLVAAPMSSLTSIAQAMQFSLSNSATSCVPRLTPGGQIVGGTLRATGRQQPGFRFMLGLTSLGDANLFGLQAAQLQSTATVTNLSAKFTDAKGRTFVSPTAATVAAAMRLSTFDSKTLTWPIAYDALRTAAGAEAYPGTMAVYAAVPVSGLSTEDASHLAQFVRFAATDGQRPGIAEGQLPDGYVPMTADFGLAHLAAFAFASADLIAGQAGDKPPATPTPSPTSGGTGGGSGSAGGSGPGVVGGIVVPGTPQPTLPPFTPGVDLPLGYTQSIGAGLAGWTLPVVVVIVLLAGATAVITQSRATLAAAANIRNRLNKIIEARLAAERRRQ
jgi:hypothetical protein